MRISSGRLKGRKIGDSKVLSRKSRGEGLRPTSSKVREALFDILRNEIAGSVFLDLYAGTGTVGLEATSRGAERVVLIEHDPKRHRAIQECIKKLDIGDKASVLRESADGFLRRAALTGLVFDIIFADPPYASGEIALVLPLIDHSPVLKTGGCLIVEHLSRNVPEGIPDNLSMIKRYRYGDTMLSLYRKEQ